MRLRSTLVLLLLVALPALAQPPAAPPPATSAPASGAPATAAPATTRPQSPVPVWIDADPSVAPGGHEVDDGFALLQAFNSPELAIRGLSIVFGNAPLAEAMPIGRALVAAAGRGDLEVLEGAAGPQDLGRETPASQALATALRAAPLRILVLGPATNVATVVKLYPELAAQMIEVIAVAGRRPGQTFTTGTGAMPHRDFNFEQDPEAFRVLIDARVPLVLAPWEISSKVWLREADLARIAQVGPAAAPLITPARDWLALWKRQFGVDGFNPFDTLAVGYLTSRRLLTCEPLPIEIRVLADDRAPRGSAAPTKPYLIVDPLAATTARALYCHRPAAMFKDDLMRRLTARR